MVSCQPVHHLHIAHFQRTFTLHRSISLHTILSPKSKRNVKKMCKKPEPETEVSTVTKKTASNGKDSDATPPKHSAHKRNTDYDWLIFLGPALFFQVTPLLPIYAIAITRIILSHVVLALHYKFVDKDNYLNKITQKQIEREKDDYLTSYYLHMWTQIALQIVFPGMFFSDPAGIGACAKEALLCHIFIVEPAYYAVHRWLHVPDNMKAMHGFHHLSINTLPTTSAVQNFQEHVVYVCTFGPAFFLPYLVMGRQHWTVIGGYLIAFDVINAWGHTNVRVRNWFLTSRYSPGKYLFYTPEFHLGHHAYFNKNFALFMPVWDYMFGTAREYQKKDVQMLSEKQQDFCFIGHNGGLGHFLTIPELCFYNVYNDYVRTFLPIKLEFFIMHGIGLLSRVFFSFYYCSRFCVASEHIGRIICLLRTPWDYMSPASYNAINQEMVALMRQEHAKYGTRYFGLGNLNKMKQLNNGGIDITKMVQEDAYLKDKKIRVWTGDSMTVASVFHQIADIPNLEQFYYIGAGGKVGTAVCEMLVRTRPNLKIRIFSRNQFLEHPNITYSNDLSEMTDYKVTLVGKILSAEMYQKAFDGKKECQTRFVLDYTVPAFPIAALNRRPENVQHIRIGMLKTFPNNPFLKGHYDLCMSHAENHIVPCHFGCLLHTIEGRETDEVGEIDQGSVERLWKMGVARGFQNIHIDYD
jgi:sterol desaturase/sphingolipid hydroxylase (fatty acid hydroxylase superfamily)